MELDGAREVSEVIKAVSGATCDMPSLEWLDLSRSSKHVYDSPSYFELSYHGNKCSFPHLRFLNLSEIKLKEIPRGLPLFGPNLTTLDLSNNLLIDESLENFYDFDIDYQNGKNFQNLSFLNMSVNQIKYILRRPPLFGPKLTTLDLSHNSLEAVSLDTFAEARSLQSLYLNGNRLTSFEYLSFCDGLNNLKQLSLFDNLFNATFYDKMTTYFANKELHLIQKEIRIIESEDQDRNGLSTTMDQDKNEHSISKTQEQGDINPVIEKANGTLSGMQDHQQIGNRTSSKDVNQYSKDPNYLTSAIYLLAVIFIVTAIALVIRKGCHKAEN